MKNSVCKFFTVFSVIFAVSVLSSCGTYNSMIEKDEEVQSAWAQVQNQYQRRMDLIPNLVSTVKGYASHESEVLTAVTNARSKAGSIQLTSEILNNPEEFKKYQEVQDSLGSSLGRLLAISENYPELKADQNFLALQDELAGTENRIATERRRFNETVKSYNSYIRKFPNNFIAGKFGFSAKQYFQATQEAQSAPKVEF